MPEEAARDAGNEAHGTNTAHSTSVIARIGPVISSIALMVAGWAVQPHGHLPFDVLQHHNRVVHHDADGEHQAEERDVVQAIPQRAMTAKVPISETGTSIIGRIMARQSCRNTSTTSPTSTMASNSVRITSAIDSRMNGVVS